MVLRRHIFTCDESVSRSSTPIFCGRPCIVVCNWSQYHPLVFVPQKIDASPIFTVSRINAKFQHCSRERKIGLRSIFLYSNTNRWYCAQLYNKILDCLRNMGAELPVFRIFHTIPCAQKMHPKMVCFLCQHGFGWQIRNTGSSAPIFLW